MAEYFTAAGYFYKTSTSAIEFVSRQPILSIRFEVLHCMSVHGDAEQEVVSHPFQPALPLVCAVAAASKLPFNLCRSRQYKLYIRTPCIVLNMCFWFRPGLGQSLGFEPVTDVPQDRAASVLSSCQELEKVA